MITVREVNENDLPRLAEYLPTQQPFLQTRKDVWEHRFAMWWELNPAFTSRIPRGWILEKDSSLAGFIGNVPVKFFIGGEERTAFAGVAWYVDPSVRGLSSIGLLARFLKQDNASLFLFNTNNKQLMKILYKNKFTGYILPGFQTEYLSILKKENVGFVTREFRIIRRPLQKIPARVLSLVRAYLHPDPVPDIGRESEYSISVCSSCDDSFFRIWKPVTDRCDVTMSRDTATLNWLYFSPVKRRQKIVLQCRKKQDNSLAGYLVFEIKRKEGAATGIMKLIDQCIEGNDQEVLRALLHFATETGKQTNLAVMELWADNPETEAYLRNTYILARESQNYTFIRFPEGYLHHSEPLKICPFMIAPPQGIDHF